MPDAGVDLYWIPLGAGGTGFVNLNGRVYERISAFTQRRQPLDVYHTAVRVGDIVVETTWPSPAGDPTERGVVVQAPVFAGPLGRVRTFRYEVRRWPGGELPDEGYAVGGPHRVSHDAARAERLLDLVGEVPPLIWGRDQERVGEMWNSNSVVSWLLAMSGHDMQKIRPPEGGRAPGWDAGVAIAGSTGSR